MAMGHFAGVYCVRCLDARHRCQAQIVVDGNPLCMRCADDMPCVYVTAAGERVADFARPLGAFDIPPIYIPSRRRIAKCAAEFRDPSKLKKKAVVASEPKRIMKQPSFLAIADIVCAEFECELSEVLGKRRDKDNARARQMCMFIYCRVCGMGYLNVAKKLSMHHSTVMASCEVIEEKMKCDEDLKKRFRLIKSRIRPNFLVA